MRTLAPLLLLLVVGCETNSLPESPPPPKSVPLVAPKLDSPKFSGPIPPPVKPQSLPPGATEVPRRTEIAKEFASLIKFLQSKGYKGRFTHMEFVGVGANDGIIYKDDGWGFRVSSYPNAKMASDAGITTLKGKFERHTNGTFVLLIHPHESRKKQDQELVAAFMEFRP